MAKLKLTSLHCERKQDVTGVDEPQIRVAGDVVWNGVLGKGDTAVLSEPSIDFSDEIEVEVRERNGDKTKKIGTTLLVKDSGAGSQPAEFKTSGAHYQLFYRVT